MEKRKFIRMIVPICIVLIVAGIWVVKNSDQKLEASSIDLELLMSYGLPIIIDFGADSCIPCKEMAPVLIKLNAQMQGKAIIKFVDVWKNQDAAKEFPIQVIPTQVLFNADGTPYVPGEVMDITFDMYANNDTGEHAFTVHQGGLTEEQMRAILLDMGVAE